MAPQLFIASLTFFFSILVKFSSSISDIDALLILKTSFQNTNAALSSWNTSIPPCNGGNANWSGVLCYKGHVWGFKLENMNLTGTIDVNAIKDLPYIRTISFMQNQFDSPWPNLNKLPGLKTIYLSDNKFSGDVPDDAFKGMQWLKIIHLSNNQFTGPIPSSLASLPRLISLKLDGNKFSGPIPQFQRTLKSFSVANNQLEGQIPATLSKIPASSFSGNEKLCGAPLEPCSSQKKSSSPSSSSSSPSSLSPSSSSIDVNGILVVVLVSLALLVIASVILFFLRRRKKRDQRSIREGRGVGLISNTSNNTVDCSSIQKRGPSSSSNNNSDDPGSSTKSRGSSNNSSKREEMKLTFVREEASEEFDLYDLLKASAEILGSTCHSSSYKATLLTGSTVVVKRFKQMNNLGKEEFKEHMRRLGRLNHPNLISLLAYYYKRDEKLFITNFIHNGCLGSRLHGCHAIGQVGLDWPKRLKIVKGVAQGIEYLYKEMPNLIAPHGNLKSSNVLLSESLEPILTNYGLVPVITQDVAHEIMVAYKSPEYLQHGRITKKTDVWSLGLLTLEILTGKVPANIIQQSGVSLVSWVGSVAQEEWTSRVFDKDMEFSTSNEGEIFKLLKIALACCDMDVDKRLDLNEAVDRIQELQIQEDNIEEDL
ncbi:unnamed protein product [Lathyrus sativus]|nr:unnamed protein product [Lathyrus sativus]